MANIPTIRAFEVTNLVLNDESENAKDKYLIRSNNVEKNFKAPLTSGEFMNVYLGKEHRYSCQNAYSELRT